MRSTRGHRLDGTLAPKSISESVMEPIYATSIPPYIVFLSCYIAGSISIFSSLALTQNWAKVVKNAVD